MSQYLSSTGTGMSPMFGVMHGGSMSVAGKLYIFSFSGQVLLAVFPLE